MELVEGPTLADRLDARVRFRSTSAADRAARSPRRSKPHTSWASFIAI